MVVVTINYYVLLGQFPVGAGFIPLMSPFSLVNRNNISKEPHLHIHSYTLKSEIPGSLKMSPKLHGSMCKKATVLTQFTVKPRSNHTCALLLMIISICKERLPECCRLQDSRIDLYLILMFLADIYSY